MLLDNCFHFLIEKNHIICCILKINIFAWKCYKKNQREEEGDRERKKHREKHCIFILPCCPQATPIFPHPHYDWLVCQQQSAHHLLLSSLLPPLSRSLSLPLSLYLSLPVSGADSQWSISTTSEQHSSDGGAADLAHSNTTLTAFTATHWLQHSSHPNRSNRSPLSCNCCCIWCSPGLSRLGSEPALQQLLQLADISRVFESQFRLCERTGRLLLCRRRRKWTRKATST